MQAGLWGGRNPVDAAAFHRFGEKAALFHLCERRIDSREAVEAIELHRDCLRDSITGSDCSECTRPGRWD